ncbi:phage baseplate assembly protein V [Paraburkholderia acidipaludis]|uniref:phage baseplate assembly protein V n=1 Tax=Paraburkholderia acidipaludis TaxID=660537 RepID=UPI00048793EA|nr:phage baseplate assembly protein V [Paraburkholderia acidipaludis]
MDANEFRRLIVNLVRKGSVADVDLTTNPPTCRVSVGDPADADNPGLTTNWIPFATVRAGTTREWSPLTKGERVLLLCPMGDPAQGVAVAGLNSDDTPPPSNSPDKHLRRYPDGAEIEYDHAAHALKATLPAGATVLIVAPGAVNVQTKTASVQADAITLDAKQTTVTGAMLVKGAFAFENGMSGQAGKSGGPTAVISGTVVVSDDLIAGGKSSAHHTHREQGDGQLVSEPQ